MTKRMLPIIDSDGILHPEHDRRDVPLSVMAAYMNIHPDTLHKQVMRNEFPREAIATHGSHNYYKPWVWVRCRETVRA